MKTSQTLEKLRKYLGKEVEVIIDRPLGSKHPIHNFLYKTNYGYFPNTSAPDGGELDVYYLGVKKPINKAKGLAVAIVHRLNDDDDRLIVVPKDNKDITDEEIKRLVHFQEKFSDFKIIR